MFDNTRQLEPTVAVPTCPVPTQRNDTQVDTTDSYERSKKNFLTENEMKSLIASAKKCRNGLRDTLLLLTIWRHGLRVSEACNLRLDDIDLYTGKIFVRRLKRSLSTMHPIEGDELRAMRKYLRVRQTNLPWLFISERKGKMTRGTINRLVDVCAQRAGIKHHVTPHHLRHSTGYYLANKGTDIRVIADYLGHRNVQVTMLYTRLSSRQFDKLWN